MRRRRLDSNEASEREAASLLGSLEVHSIVFGRGICAFHGFSSLRSPGGRELIHPRAGVREQFRGEC